MNERTKRDSITELLYRLEMRLLDPSIRRSPDDVKMLLTDDFVEIGAAGKVYDLDAIVTELRTETPFFWTVSDFTTRPLGPGLIMVNYQITITVGPQQTRKRSLRTSIWKQFDRTWRMVFHQGTALPQDE